VSAIKKKSLIIEQNPKESEDRVGERAQLGGNRKTSLGDWLLKIAELRGDRTKRKRGGGKEKAGGKGKIPPLPQTSEN